MKQNINKNLVLYFNKNYPCKLKNKSSKKYLVSIGIGGNIGNVHKTLNKLFLNLVKDSRFDILQTSPLLLNPPFGFYEQKDFLNGIILLKTNLCPNDFLKNMQRLENRFKRKRSFKNAARTLDIDIIFFHNKKIHTKKLIVPHKFWHERQSVVIPLQRMSR